MKKEHEMENAIEERKSLGKSIKQKREERGLSLTDLATKLDINKDRLLKIENGQRPLGCEVLISLARIFDMSTDEILGLSTNRAILIGFGAVKIITACGTFEVCSKKIQISF